MTRPLEELFDELSGPSRPLGPVSDVAWPEPAKLRRRAEHRRTVRRTSVASSVAVLAVVAIAVPMTLANQHSGSVSPASSVTPVNHIGPAPTTAGAKAAHSDSPAAGAKATSPVLPGSVIPTGAPQQFGPVGFVVPSGWTATPGDVPAQFGTPAHRVCVAPPVTAGQLSLDDCAGLEIWYDGFLPGAYGTSFVGNRESSPAWFHGKGPATCPDTTAGTGPLATTTGGPDVWDWNLVGTRSATHNAWTVHCTDGTSFTPQSWYLPKSQLVFFSYVSNPTAQAILATVTIS